MERLRKSVQEPTESQIDELSEKKKIYLREWISIFYKAQIPEIFLKGTWKQGDLFANSPSQSWRDAIFEEWLIKRKMTK